MRFKKCIKLKKRFVSFVCALLVFSASWLPYCISVASADTVVSDSGNYALTLYPFMNGTGALGWSAFDIPSSRKLALYSGDITPSGDTGYNIGLRFESNVYKPADYHRTAVFVISPVIYSYLSSTGNPKFDYQWRGTGEWLSLSYKKEAFTSEQWEVLDGGCHITTQYLDSDLGNTSAGFQSLPLTFNVVIPAGSTQLKFNAVDSVRWRVYDFSGQISINFDMYGAYIINSADWDLIYVVRNILSNLTAINGNVSNISNAVVNIVNQLIALNADTDTIISLLTNLEDLSNRQLTELERISFNVDAIYALLAEALVEESEEFNESTQQLVDSVQESANSEARWQANMQGSYEELNISNTNFGNLNGSIVFVMQLFEDMLDTFGAWSILFTFPLTIGIALLVIGRISRSGGGNSSRNTEHKGGEGGA